LTATGDPSLVPATNATTVVTVHPVFTEWQDAILHNTTSEQKRT
jgi:hypothetical protein